MASILSVALKEITGPLNQLMTNLAGENGRRWLEEFKKFLRKEPCWVKSLLEFIGTVTIPARTEKFVAKRAFILNNRKDTQGMLQLSYVCDKFRKFFLLDEGKIENNLIEQTLHYAKLRKPTTSSLIIEELGGEMKAEATLWEVYHLMTQQPNGGDGILLSNGYANIFYIRNIKGVLCAVGVCWYDDGWNLHANLISSLNGLGGGHRVFFRNS